MIPDALARPAGLLKIIDRMAPWAFVAAILTSLIGLYYIFFHSPPDYLQGDAVRIMYIHVPASWFALMIYSFMGLCSAIFLIFRIPVAAYISQSVAPVGAMYAFISLATGAIWGKPMWGTWWVWDARLTSMLILFIMYLGYLFLISSFDEREKSLRVASVLAILGLINIPIIKFSVDWWHTLHQPASLLKSGGPSIHFTMLIPLIWMSIGYLSLTIALSCLRLKTTFLSIKSEVIQAKLVWENAST